MDKYPDKELMILCEQIVDVSRWKPPEGSSYMPAKYVIYEWIVKYCKNKAKEDD